MPEPGPTSIGAAPWRPVGLRLPAVLLLGAVLFAFGWVLAFVVGSVLRIRRAHVIRSMRTAGISCPERTASRMYRSLGRGIAELLLLLLRPASLRRAVRLDRREVASWLGGANGAVIATAHTANWDLVACRLAELLPLTVVTKHLSGQWLDRLWQESQ